MNIQCWERKTVFTQTKIMPIDKRKPKSKNVKIKTHILKLPNPTN